MSLLEEATAGDAPLAVVPEPEEKEDTEYVVFKLREVTASNSPGEAVAANEVWEKIGVARGGRAAVIRSIAGKDEGIYSATPSRSWKPARVGVKVDVTVTEL